MANARQVTVDAKKTTAAVLATLTLVDGAKKLTLKGTDNQLYSVVCEPALKHCEQFVENVVQTGMQFVKNTPMADMKEIAAYDCVGHSIRVAQNGSHALTQEGELLRELLQADQVDCSRAEIKIALIFILFIVASIGAGVFIYLLERTPSRREPYAPIPDQGQNNQAPQAPAAAPVAHAEENPQQNQWSSHSYQQGP